MSRETTPRTKTRDGSSLPGITLTVASFLAFYIAGVIAYDIAWPFFGGWSEIAVQFLFRIPVSLAAYRILSKRRPERTRRRMRPAKLVTFLTVYALLIDLPMKFGYRDVFAATNSLGPENPFAGLANIFLIAPLAEELSFRGMLYPLSRKKLGIRPAVIANAVLFAFCHLGNAGNMISAATQAVTACLMYEASGTILYGTLVHYCFNAMSLPMVFIEPDIPDAIAGLLFAMPILALLLIYRKTGNVTAWLFDDPALKERKN